MVIGTRAKKILVVGSVVVVCAIFPPFILQIVGFATTGVALGSLASLWMSSIGNVAAGSLFASLQSLGSMGIGAAFTTPMLIFEATAAAISSFLSFRR